MISLQNLLEEQFQRHKGMQTQDVYKLLYQGVFGPEHFICGKTRQGLYEEFEKALPEKGIMFEKVSPVFEIYRVNIRPYKAYKGTKEELFTLFQESAKIKTGNSNLFRILWHQFKKINNGKKYFSDKNIEAFEKKHSIPGQLPALHHSKKYRNANKPSYVVVNLQKFCEDDD